MLLQSMAGAIFTAAMIYFFQVKELPSHDWNHIKNNFWIYFLVSMIPGFGVASKLYDHK